MQDQMIKSYVLGFGDFILEVLQYVIMVSSTFQLSTLSSSFSQNVNLCMDHSGHGLGHWLSPYPEWSLLWLGLTVSWRMDSLFRIVGAELDPQVQWRVCLLTSRTFLGTQRQQELWRTIHLVRRKKFNSLANGRFESNLRLNLMKKVSLVKLPSDESHWTLPVIGQHWPTSHYLSKYWLQSMRHMASLGHNESTYRPPWGIWL